MLKPRVHPDLRGSEPVSLSIIDTPRYSLARVVDFEVLLKWSMEGEPFPQIDVRSLGYDSRRPGEPDISKAEVLEHIEPQLIKQISVGCAADIYAHIIKEVARQSGGDPERLMVQAMTSGIRFVFPPVTEKIYHGGRSGGRRP